MRPATRKKLSLAALLAALVAIGVLGPLTYRSWEARRSVPGDTVAGAPVPSQGPAQPAAPAPAVPASPAPAPAVAPEEESEIDRSPNAASPSGPVLSFGRAAGLHLAPDPLKLNSSAALVVDQDSGEVLAQKNAQAVLPIASLTKLMTSLVVLEAKQPMDEVLTITDDDVDRLRNSRSSIRVGTTLTRQEALQLALMSSENRAAHALGRTYPGGLDRMVATMNAKARQLGMNSTTFVDPTGLSNANKSTARDVALLVRATANNPLIAQYSTTRRHAADLGGRTLQYINSNRLVRNGSDGWDIFLQKTGYIVEAGRCLTMATRLAGRNVIMVLLDAESNGNRVSDAERLRRWTVAQIGGPEALAALDTERANTRKAAAREAAETRRVASARKAESRKKSTAVARKAEPKKTTTAARKKQGQATATAAKKSGKATTTARSGAGKDGGRVKQTFAAGKDANRS